MSLCNQSENMDKSTIHVYFDLAGKKKRVQISIIRKIFYETMSWPNYDKGTSKSNKPMQLLQCTMYN